MIRVLIVDDQRIVRAGLRMLCESDEEFTVVGEAADGGEAMRLAAEYRPDIVLMDLRMPGVDGTLGIKNIVGASLPSRILVLTTFDDDEHIFPALMAGASGFLVKDTAPQELLEAMRRTVRDEMPISPHVLRRLVTRAVSTPMGQENSPVDRGGLTERELQVLQLIAAGLSNSEIADRLHLGITTVKTHIGNLMIKTGCDNRVRLAVHCVRLGITA